MNSTLVSIKVNGGEQLLGLTELDSGERVLEEATIDASGRLVDGKQTVTGLAVAGEPAPVTRVAFEPAQGTITMTTTTTTRELSLDWRVQSDLPWVWLPLLAAGRDATTGTPAPIATPLGAWVAFRAAHAGSAVRLIDLGARETHTLTADQLVIADGAGATVVLGDDSADVEGGKPRRLRLAALGTSLELLDSRAPSNALLAALRCTAPGESPVP